jgi:hypothetical protein
MAGLPNLEHVAALSDDVGIIQHATESIPDRATGYCTDDVARAFMVALAYDRLVPLQNVAIRLAATYLAFLHDAQLPDGRFHNFMNYARAWLDKVGTKDSYGRAMWALGYGMRHAPTQAWRRVCRDHFNRALKSVDWLEFPRSQAYAMLGLAHACIADDNGTYRRALGALAASLYELYLPDPQWTWFEDEMTYDNARLPEAMLRAGMILRNAAYIEAGIASLDFLETVTVEDGIFVPIGNDGWYRRGGPRARYAQQPLEATAMIDAELAAFEADQRPERLRNADLALAWYEGKNTLYIPMGAGGGCYDGLESTGPNRNMGAESTLARLAGAYTMAEYRRGRIASRGEVLRDDDPGVRGT